MKYKIQRYKKRIMQNHTVYKVFTNSSWIITDKVFTMVVGVLVTALIARYFGPLNFGDYNYALSLVTLFSVISTLGLETLTVKSIIDKKYDEGIILCTSLLLRVIGGILLTIVSIIVIKLLAPYETNLHILVLIMASTMVFKSLEVIEYWIQANQKAKISSIIRMVAYVLISLLKVMLVIFGGNLYHYALIYLFNVLIIGFALLIAYFKYRESSSKWRVSFEYSKYILSNSWYLIISGIIITIYMQIDKVMLGYLLPNRTGVGIYSAATQIASMWYFVPRAIITSLTPVIIKKKNEKNGYLESMQTLYDIVTWLGLSFGILILIFSDFIVGILYGPEYYAASSILKISVWAGTFAMLGTSRGVWMICENIQKYTIIYVGFGAVVNVILNYFLIPSMGGYGASIATLISQITVAIIAPILIKETRLSVFMIIRSFNPKRLFELINIMKGV